MLLISVYGYHSAVFKITSVQSLRMTTLFQNQNPVVGYLLAGQYKYFSAVGMASLDVNPSLGDVV